MNKRQTPTDGNISNESGELNNNNNENNNNNNKIESINKHVNAVIYQYSRFFCTDSHVIFYTAINFSILILYMS